MHADAVIAAITPKTKAIILNSPCNPTGALVDEATLAAIADAAAKRGIWIDRRPLLRAADLRDVPHNLPKVLFDRHRDRTVLAGSASKAYAMTGWRCGWTIAPKELTTAFNTIQGQTTSNITSITQKAALAAVTGSQDAVTVMLDEYRQRRDNIHAWLTANPGIQCVKPKGAFYLFPDISGLLSPDGVKTSAEFAPGAAREGARRRDAGRGVRRARLPAHLVRDVDGAAARRARRGSCGSPSRCSRRRPAPAVEHATTTARGSRSSRDVSTRAFETSVVVVAGNVCRPLLDASARDRRCGPCPHRRRRARDLRRGRPRPGPSSRRSSSFPRTPPRSRPSRGSATSSACRSSSAAPAPATPAARCRRAAASCSRWSG